MREIKHRLFLMLLITVLIGCRKSTTESTVKGAIAVLKDRFPQLAKEKSGNPNNFQLVRSVTNGEKKFQLHLYSTPKKSEDQQQLVVMINAQGHCYALPFFSNTHRHYWNFRFDNPVPGIKPVNTTFEKELTLALDTLSLNDTLGTAGAVIDELFFSLLHCKIIDEGDSSELSAILMNYNHNNAPQENSGSCYLRIRKNYEAISSNWHPQNFINNYNAYSDERNNRIYQFDFGNLRRRKKLKLSINLYRTDCITYPIYM